MRNLEFSQQRSRLNLERHKARISKNIDSLEDVFQKKRITFDDRNIRDALLKNNTKKVKDKFHISDILDMDDSDDEILKKFQTKSPRKKKSPNLAKIRGLRNKN